MQYSKLQSWTNVLGHFCVSGAFPIPIGPTPPLSPQTMLDACIQNFFPSFNFVQGWVGGGGVLQESFENDTLF